MKLVVTLNRAGWRDISEFSASSADCGTVLYCCVVVIGERLDRGVWT